jgi:thioredoxin reductase (NADPH)
MESRNYDVVILGSGPAGLQAAIHAARRKVSVLVLGKKDQSSMYHHHIENYAFLFKTTGDEMLKVGMQQAESFGADFMEEDILKITSNESGFEFVTESGRHIAARTFIIATGTNRKRLGVPGEKTLVGKGVSYCVDCDGNFYRGEDVAVIGGQSAAVDGALILTGIAGQVHLVCDALDVPETLARRLSESTVHVHKGIEVREITGNDQVKGLVLTDGTELPVTGVFVELGAKGLLELAGSLGVRLDDEMKHIQTDKKQATNIPGIYAAGDICGPPWQLAKAVGEGCVAGIEAAAYAKRHQPIA